MPISKVDLIYKSLILSKYFDKGWGNPDVLKKLLEFRKTVSKSGECYKLVPEHYPVKITKMNIVNNRRIINGYFITPLELYFPDLLPAETKNAYFQAIFPLEWKSDRYRPVCLHMAGTGDHYFWRRRRFIAKPLLQESGIASIILENPFYGLRKPSTQVRSVLHNVTDIFLMGVCLMMEAIVMFQWCLRNGLGPLGVTGISMGGHMASLAAASWPFPIVLVPCLSWTSASPVFTEGVMSHSINWDLLIEQIKNFKDISEIDINISNQDIKSDRSKDEINTELTSSKDKINSELTSSKDKINSELTSSKDKINSELTSSKDKINTELTSSKDKINSELTRCKEEITSQLTKESLIHRKPYETPQIIKTLDTPTFSFKPNPLFDLRKTASIENSAGVNKFLSNILIRKSTTGKLRKHHQEALEFMKTIMDDCTNLSNYPVPVDTSLIICFCALNDAYVPRNGVCDLSHIWPGVEIRYLECGHISAMLFHRKAFREAIVEAFQRYQRKYMSK